MGYERLARKLVQLSGGEENIQAVFHCSTRLHFKLKDPGQVKKAAAEELDGVVSAAVSGGYFHIVTGINAGEVHNDMLKYMRIGRMESGDREETSGFENPAMQPGRSTRRLDAAETSGLEDQLFHQMMDTAASIFNARGGGEPVMVVLFGYKNKEPAIAGGIPHKTTEEPVRYQKREMIASPFTGETIPLEQVNDPAFSSGMLGKGVGIKPSVGKLFAPVSGTVTAVFPSGHAIGITSTTGIQILIHIGIDTVRLEGKYYHVHVKKGQPVEKGEVLIEFDIPEIEAAGYDLTSPVVITNSDNYFEVLETDRKKVDASDQLMTIVG
ncbi:MULTISPECIES: glucose PTS transporter subunit IIA [Heyndrickxia]|uniref:glucose PTS transporter subunit IIA n=1 Tax=Heyndrickxia TaxID=2837504 RepID=UPI002E1ADA33|nr:glucose PTS transporter subunit IIA [Weizmannia sp. CD-2023]MED4839902.1 glucose PTS transporter subunit IIA [Weizmannia sp. CD-2023]MED4901329.1 glucose PTS transporter subunit IIA [Weizmannia sp. CD-2023]